MYKKTQPDIRYIDFLKLVGPVSSYMSLEGHEYIVRKIEGSTLHFVRTSTNREWSMDLKQVLLAYKELKEFKTENFKPYVPRRHSPALGLLLHLMLLEG